MYDEQDTNMLQVEAVKVEKFRSEKLESELDTESLC